jgi:hypothetical protein
VSAQKALVAKVNRDDALLEKSRLPALEAALSGRLIPAKRELVGGATQADVKSLVAGVRGILEARMAGVNEQIGELSTLRGKNQDVVEHMLDRVREEKERFDRGLARYTALRNVYTQQTNALFDLVGLESLRGTAARTRERMQRSQFTRGVREAMGDFFAHMRRDFDEAGRKSVEIHDMMRAMYQRFATEHGIEPFVPPPFSVLKYQKEIDRLERAYNTHLNTLWNMVSKAKFPLMKRFFETVASRAKHAYVVANRDVEAWLKAVMSPLETQVREHQLQLRRRLESIKRIHVAGDELEERLDELGQTRATLLAQLAALDAEAGAIEALAMTGDPLPAVANA